MVMPDRRRAALCGFDLPYGVALLHEISEGKDGGILHSEMSDPHK